MKATSISGDMLVKLALGAVALGAVVYAVFKIKGAGTEAAKAVGTAVNPADPQNIVNRGVTAIGTAVTGDSGWTLGGWIYDITHADPMQTTPAPIPDGFGMKDPNAGWDDAPVTAIPADPYDFIFGRKPTP